MVVHFDIDLSNERELRNMISICECQLELIRQSGRVTDTHSFKASSEVHSSEEVKQTVSLPESRSSLETVKDSSNKPTVDTTSIKYIKYRVIAPSGSIALIRRVFYFNTGYRYTLMRGSSIKNGSRPSLPKKHSTVRNKWFVDGFVSEEGLVLVDLDLGSVSDSALNAFVYGMNYSTKMNNHITLDYEEGIQLSLDLATKAYKFGSAT